MSGMIVIPRSENIKTGNIIQSYSSASTCPATSCPFKNNGCYAQNIRTASVWKRADNPQDPRYCEINQYDIARHLVSATIGRDLKKTILFRHNVAGDIAIEGTNKIDSSKVWAVYFGIDRAEFFTEAKIKGYTYTHCGITQEDVRLFKKVENKFVINVSCETLARAQWCHDAGMPAVLTSANVEEDIKELALMGVPAMQCLAQNPDFKDMTCEKCKLCSKTRNTVVVFGVHGCKSSRASKVINIVRTR